MKAKMLRAIKPSPSVWLFLALLLVAQFSFYSRLHVNEPSLAIAQYGIGGPVEISYRDGMRQSVRIDWTVLAINLTTCYLLSVFTVALTKRATGLRRPFPVYGGTVLGVVCLGFLASIVLSRLYWGYFFRRPPVLSELEDVAEVIGIVPVTTEETPGGEYRFVVNPDYSIAGHVAYAREDPYYSLDERVLVYLEEKHLLPPGAAMSPVDIDLYDRLLETGLLAEPRDGYMSAGLLDGVVVQARTTSGSELVFVSATGREVSNDHYPCYEMVFERHSESEGLTFVRGQRFFYDLAGLEGAEWYVAWITLSLMGLALALPTVTMTVGVRNVVLSRKAIVQAEPNYHASA